MKTIEQITEILENLPDSELRDYWNEYQAETSGEGQIFDFDEAFFEEYFSSPGEAARAVFFGNIQGWNDKYVVFNGYGNLESNNYISELISLSDLANHIGRDQDSYDSLLEN